MHDHHTQGGHEHEVPHIGDARGLRLAAAWPAQAASDANLCISGYRIDHTTVTDDQTILFFMSDHSVYRNRLPVRCLGLKNDPRGFSYEPTDPAMDELCSNQMVIRLNSTRSACQIGVFEAMPKGFRG